MQNHFVKYGLVMGVASIIFSMILYLSNPAFLMTWGSWAGMIITVYFMVKSVSDTKNDSGGFLTLSDSFKAAWLTFVLGSFISSVFLFVLVNFVDPSLIEVIRNTQIEALQKIGELVSISPDKLEEQISVIKDTNPFGLAQIALSIPISFLFPGAVIAIIIAAILRKNDPNVPVV